MITQLTGKITEMQSDYLILDVNGVGYKVESFAPFRLGLEGTEVQIRTYTHVRETELRLFGFANAAELELFERLLQVSGVGPKTAMLLVSNFSVKYIIQAVQIEDPKALAVKGVGTKTLAKVVIELKGKLTDLASRLGTDNGESYSTGNSQLTLEAKHSDLSAALDSLGYKPLDYKDILEKIDSDGTLANQVKQALQLLR